MCRIRATPRLVITWRGILFKQPFCNQQDHPNGDSTVSNVKNRPPGRPNTDVYEIDYFLVKKTVDEVADGATQNERKSKAEIEFFVACPHNIDKYDYGGKQRKDCKEQLPAYLNPKCHAGILNVGQAQPIADQFVGHTVL